MRVLVTGAGGQLGRDVVDALAGRVPTGGLADDPATGRLGARTPVRRDRRRPCPPRRLPTGAPCSAVVEGVRPHVVVHAGGLDRGRRL